MTSLVTWASSVISPWSNWMYASMEFMRGELQNARMLRKCACAMAVPIFPGDVPMTPDGFRANAFFPYGRLAQSIAFFNPPGIERFIRGHEQDRVDGGDRGLEAAATGG